LKNKYFPTWTLYFARRFLNTKRKEKGHTSSLLSIAGVTIGIASLISVIGVMNGFQNNFINNILEVGSFHLQIQAPLKDDLEEGLSQNKSIRSFSPSGDIETLIGSRFSDSRGVAIKGFPEDIFDRDPGLAKALTLIQGRLEIQEGGILLGHRLAQSLGVTIGDQVTLVIYKTKSPLGFGRETKSFTLAGTFRTGYLDYDRGLGLISLEDARDYFLTEEQIYIGVKLKNPNHFKRLLQSALLRDLEVYSWKDFNKSFFGALRMEKLMMFFLIGLIFLVVGFNIHHNMTRSVLERSEEIAILRALGVTPPAIQGIFLWEGIIIGALSGFMGAALGLLLGNNINQVFVLSENIVNQLIVLINQVFGILRLPFIDSVDFYSSGLFYIDGIPCEFYFSEVFLITLLGVSSAWAASYFAARKVSELKTMEILRNE